MRKRQYGRTTWFSHRAPDGTYIRVYLSSAPVADRWTAVFDSADWRASVNPGMVAMLGMSDDPHSAGGFSQFSEGREGPTWGRRCPGSKSPGTSRITSSSGSTVET